MQFIKYLPLSLFVALGLKFIAIGANYESVALLAVIGGIAAYYETHSQNKKVKELEARQVLLEAKLDDATKTIKNVDTSFQAFKLGNGSRMLNRV